MKKFIMIAALLLVGVSAMAQRGVYGTLQPVTPGAGTIYKYVLGIPVATTHDTLSGVDTGLVRWTFNNNYGFNFDLSVTKLTGTVAGTALLQGSNDNSTWFTLTGSTTYCATCTGASATVTNTTGTKHYQWYIPPSTTGYKYYQVQTISSGTMTATYSGTAYYSY